MIHVALRMLFGDRKEKVAPEELTLPEQFLFGSGGL